SRRSATRARRRLMGTRCSGRLPRCCAAGAATCGKAVLGTPVGMATAEISSNAPGTTKSDPMVVRAGAFFGQVSRSFQLGQDLDESRASARFNEGVLELSLPKKIAVQAKRLVIE
ncbi:MAG: Hsp20/alpha crystallin family protein, partial [Zoogloea sp.]|nr:Hsp20/alpha crystallin family protein [Zoogloea sp.]